MPYPQTTPTPHGRSVPARSTANVSLRTMSVVGPSVRADPSDEPAVVGREVGSGQAVHTEVGDGQAFRVEARLVAPLRDRDADRHRWRSSTCCCMSHVLLSISPPSTRAAPSTVPSRRRSATSTLRTAGVDGEDAPARLAHGRSSSSSIDTNVAPMLAETRRSSGPIPSPVPPGHVWSSTTAPSPWARTPFERVVRDRRAGSMCLPVLELDVPMHVAIAERGRARPSTRASSGARTERTSEPRAWILAGRGPDDGLCVEHVAPQTRRRAGAASARGSGSGARPGGRRRRSVWRWPAATPPTVPARRTSLARPRPRACRGCVRRSAAGTTVGPGCSASNVNATRGAVVSLTCRDLRCADVRARRTARCDRELPRQELRGDDRDRGASSRIQCGRSRSHRALGGLAVFDDDEDARLRAATSSSASPRSSSRVSGSVAMTIAAEIRSRELERAVAELGGLRATRSGARRPPSP